MTKAKSMSGNGIIEQFHVIKGRGNLIAVSLFKITLSCYVQFMLPVYNIFSG